MKILKYIIKGLIGIVVFIAIIIIINASNKQEIDINNSIENKITIDSLKKDNSKLILEVETLDSIKNVQTIKVKTLDNDSTIKLFYELIRK